jgi:hypothetical protein
MIENTENQLTVVDELKGFLTDIKDRIKSDDFGKQSFIDLSNSAKIIQNKINEILAKKGLVTQSDINDAYDVLKEEKRKSFEDKSKRLKKKLIIFSIVAVAIIVAVRIYKKK